MAQAVLYSFRRCPYAMRARMGLDASAINYEHREVLLRDKPAAMLAASPKGTVPVFVRENGEVIDESLTLLIWALTQNDPEGWLDCDRAAADALIADNDGPFKDDLDRYKYKSRYQPSAARGEVDLAARGRLEPFLRDYEVRLTAAPYLLGERQSLADIAIFPFIRQFAGADKDWWSASPYANLRRWLKMHTDSPRFLRIMQKHPLWREPSK